MANQREDTYRIRRAEPRDIPALLRLLQQVNRVHWEIRPDLFRLGTKYGDAELRDILANPDTPVFVCCDAADEVQGYCFCVLQRPGNRLLTDILTLYIDDLCVDERVRGRGIGERLYRYTVEYARSLGCHNVTLNVWTGNDSAQAFYQRMGLKPQKVGMELRLDE